MGTETKISKTIRDGLTALGIWNIRIQSGMLAIGKRFIHLAPKGTSDILIMDYDKTGSVDNPGKCGWLEVKTEDGELSPKQIEFQEIAIGHGLKVGTVRSLDEAKKTIRDWIKEDKNARESL